MTGGSTAPRRLSGGSTKRGVGTSKSTAHGIAAFWCLSAAGVSRARRVSRSRLTVSLVPRAARRRVMAGVPIANSLVEVHGTDAGMMTGVARAIATVSALMILITACERAETLPVRVESLEENLAALRDAARAWRPDAYLESASLRLLDEGSASYLIWANFNSPSEMYESLERFNP